MYRDIQCTARCMYRDIQCTARCMYRDIHCTARCNKYALYIRTHVLECKEYNILSTQSCGMSCPTSLRPDMCRRTKTTKYKYELQVNASKFEVHNKTNKLEKLVHITKNKKYNVNSSNLANKTKGHREEAVARRQQIKSSPPERSQPRALRGVAVNCTPKKLCAATTLHGEF